MRRTPLLIVAGALALAGPVAACGGDDDSPTTTAAAGGASSLTVHAKDTLKFDRTSYTATAGDIDVTYVNDGQVGHTLLVKGVDDFKLQVGGTDHGSVDLEPGTYTLYCDIAGHEGAGMKATLTVK